MVPVLCGSLVCASAESRSGACRPISFSLFSRVNTFWTWAHGSGARIKMARCCVVKPFFQVFLVKIVFLLSAVVLILSDLNSAAQFAWQEVFIGGPIQVGCVQCEKEE
mmetsp:Transcript_48432/g.128264  ORF Transcript_48432/g.128264 Transcript_48432/m.128264 type:complete len:108 (+) Transcript_48432:2042-2365(+)